MLEIFTDLRRNPMVRNGVFNIHQPNNRRRHMRKSVLALTAAAAMLAGGAIMADRAGAMTLGGPEGIRGPLDTINPVEQTGCYRRGWHGWGWYPFCGRHYGHGHGYGWERDR